MFDSLPTTSIPQDTLFALATLLQNDELREGIEHGHLAFFDEFESNNESWSVDELTTLVEESALTPKHLEKTLVHAYLLDEYVQGHDVRKVDLREVNKHRERLGQDMFYYGLGFLLGFIDQGLRPTEDVSQ